MNKDSQRTSDLRHIAEQFHSTPDTQTDESYNHPEDIEHFAAHEAIERKEAEREAEFQGISVEEAIKVHEDAEKEAAEAAKKPKPTRVANSIPADPAVRFNEARKESEEHGDWGTGDAGYKVPQTPGERLRSAWSITLLYWRFELMC